MVSYINNQLLNTNLKILSNELDINIDNTIRSKLKNELEGLCNGDGYIIKDSIQLIHKTMGKVVIHDNNSYINYDITYKAKLISPSEGDIIECYVSNINKLGVILYIKLSDDDVSEDSPLIIMVPKDYFNDSQYNINDINIGQKLRVIVVGVRVKYRSQKIQVIAKPE